MWDLDRIVAVVSPDNARPLTQVGGADDWVVQPAAIGIMDAIRRGLRSVDTDWVVLLCADNTFEINDAGLSRIQANLYHAALFGARQLAPEEERRFTRYYNHGSSARFLEAGIEPRIPTQGCWIGPLMLPTAGLRNGSSMPTIADCVNVATHGLDLIPVEMNCADFGVVEAL